MAHRHKVQARAKGGRVVYEGKGSNVEKEAEERNTGGRVVGKVSGSKGSKRFARGGKVGADTHPFSSAGGKGMAKFPGHHKV